MIADGRWPVPVRMRNPEHPVSDIFLSYNRDDQQVARRFAEAFEAHGLRVWWDTALRAGEAYDEVTEAALRSAKAVVVLWSKRAVASRWVRTEATIALRNKTLVPCMIEPCERPIMFELTQTADLVHWNGGDDDPVWRAFLGEVVRRVGPGPALLAVAEPVRSPQSERRHLTFLSCRLEDAGGDATHDPEDWQAIIQAAEPPITAAVTALGGVVTWHSDQMSAIFGYPIAYEDAAERAVRAGLAIAATLCDGRSAVQARVGVHAATALVGTGRDGAVEIFGDGAAMAVRVRGQATPGAVVFSAEVAELVAGRIDHERLDSAVFRAIGLQAATVPPLGRRFVGRDDELALLASRWRRVAEGDGQHLLIKGEPGIGKSRLIEAFRASITGQPHRWISWNGASLFANSPFHAVVQMLGQLLEARGGDPVAALQTELATAGMPGEAFDLVATMMALPMPGGQATDMAPAERRRRLLETMAEWVFALAREMPLILVVEDLHWVDPSTLELVQILVEQGGTDPLLVIGTGRPEFRKAWPDRDHHGQINLGRLDARQTRALVVESIGEASVDDDIIDRLIARTDGVPFFVEELARRIVTHGDAAGDIPTTLRGLLAARVDRLGAAKETAQLGAILGRTFDYAMIAAIAGIDAAQLDAHLGHMAAEEIVYQRGVPPRSTYSFKHALTHEAAYELLPKARRAREHRRVAELIQARFSREAEAHPEIIAHHFANGGNLEQAARYWLQAGQQALRRNAHFEAIAHLRNALGAVAMLADSPESQLIEFDIQATMGTATVVAKGQASPEIEAVWNRALHLSRTLGDSTRQGQAIFGLWLFETVSANHRAALAHSNAIVDLARSSGNEDLLITGTVSRISSSFFLGRVDDVIEGSDAILAAYDIDRHAGHRFQFGQDPAAMARAYRGQALWLKGDSAAAAAAMDDALGFARQTGHLYTLANVIAYAGWLQQYQAADAALDALASELTEMCTKQRVPLFLGNGIMLTGWLRYHRGEAEGAAVYEQGLEIYRATGSRCFLPYRWSVLGDALSDRGDHARAAALFAEALAAIDRTSERWAESEVHRLHAISLARKGAGTGCVQASFERAIVSARDLGLRAWERRAIASLDDFLAQCGRAGPA